METETLNRETPRGLASLPRAVWIGGGVLCLTVAALAGALVTKTVDAPRAAATAPASLASADVSTAPIGTPVPSRQDEVPPPPRSVAPAPEPLPATAVRPVPSSQGTSYAQASSQSAAPVVARPAPAPCVNCGTVESVQTVKVKGQGTGVGAVAGGVLGGVVGNQFGHGNGKAAMTVLGAVGGGFAGNEVERRTRAETTFDVRVRMRDGSHRVVRSNQPPSVGTRVAVEGNRLRVLNG